MLLPAMAEQRRQAEINLYEFLKVVNAEDLLTGARLSSSAIAATTSMEDFVAYPETYGLFGQDLFPAPSNLSSSSKLDDSFLEMSKRAPLVNWTKRKRPMLTNGEDERDEEEEEEYALKRPTIR